MNFVRTRTRLAGLTAATAATAAVLLGPAVASAGPAELAEPLLTSDCTFAQVEAALRVEAPELAQLLDANPSQKAGMAKPAKANTVPT